MFRNENGHCYEKNENTHYSYQLLFAIIKSGIATLGTHPLRVLLNEAGVQSNPFQTIKGASCRLFHDAHINIARGTTATALQSMTKYTVQQYFGEKSEAGRILAAFCAGFVGVAATPIEVGFMRKNYMRSSAVSASLWKYNLPILAFFTTRELGFCFSVFGTDDLKYYQRAPVFLMSALVSAIAHKLVSVELTKDIRQISHQVPDYSVGYRAVMKNIAYGNYTHPTFSVVNKNPKTVSQLAINFLSATCGANMYFWRLTYISAFAGLMGFANRQLCKEKDVVHIKPSAP
jgi:hypothetical protein